MLGRTAAAAEALAPLCTSCNATDDGLKMKPAVALALTMALLTCSGWG